MRIDPAARLLDNPLDDKLSRLADAFRAMQSVLVCYSGGVDSAFVLTVASRVLGSGAIGMTTVSDSLPPGEREQAAALAEHIGAEHRFVDSHEMQNPAYVANAMDRCFHCKSELYSIAEAKRREWSLTTIVNGTNLDDLGDYRPGLKAARDAAVRSPLVECGFRKIDVREGAKRLGLPVWDKPAAACLSSRIPYGTSVTTDRLRQIGTLEANIKELGFVQVRVRYHDKLARIELSPSDIERALEPTLRDRMVQLGKAAGFAYITLDLAGYRVGSHNELLAGAQLRVLPSSSE